MVESLIPEFTMKMFFCFSPGVGGIVKRAKMPDMSFINVGNPVLVNAVPANTSNLSFTMTPDGTIGLILRWCCFAQICPSVVRWIKVAMINLLRRPFAGHYQPRKAMRHVLAALDSNFVPLSYPGSARRFPGGRPLAKRDFPSKDSRLGIVIEDRPNVIGRKIVAGAFVPTCRMISHGDGYSSLWSGSGISGAILSPIRQLYQPVTVAAN